MASSPTVKTPRRAPYTTLSDTYTPPPGEPQPYEPLKPLSEAELELLRHWEGVLPDSLGG